MSANRSKKWLASDNLLFQILGALTKRWWLVIALFIIVATILYFLVIEKIDWSNFRFQTILHWIANYKHQLLIIFEFIISVVSLYLTIFVCNTLTNIFSLRKKETQITWCQICILFALGLWIISILLIFNITDKTINTAAFGILGSILAWIFQDTIRGVVAFIHLRLNNLLQIDDWIKVPKYDVDGKVTRVTLTNVTIYNWDTTTSTIPTSSLLSDHFINMQKMSEGKTYGRKMSLSFIMDTGSFYTLSKKDVDRFKTNSSIIKFLPQDETHEDMTNAQLYRLYIYHWLLRNQHVSQQPCLTVSWKKHTESGITLHMNGFITDSSATAFEWQQSLIIEHVFQSLEWFGLRLYQSPSSYDTSSSTIYIADKPLTKRTEE